VLPNSAEAADTFGWIDFKKGLLEQAVTTLTCDPESNHALEWNGDCRRAYGIMAAVSPISVAKFIGGPGSLGFLAVSCFVGLLLSYALPKWRTIGRAWLLGTLLVYIVLGFPIVAGSIASSLPRVPAPSLATVGKLDELIVLGGDNENGRVVETLDVWRALKPEVVLLLGDALLQRRLEDVGIPADRIRLLDEPATTRARMESVAAELRARHVRAGLVASRLQMPRVIELARTFEVNLLFLPSELDHELPTSGGSSLTPSYGALEISRDALYERAALSYYRSRGWIRAEP
jgi:uncharacterized SAM-binding protein YcdF (DUF218 family)